MSTPTSGPRNSARHRKQKSPVIAIILVVVGMVVLFAAGYGLSRVIQGSGSSSSQPTASPSGESSESVSSPSASPLPCVTVTVTPGAGLPSTSQVTTNVYNATDRTGLAATTAEELQRRGFVIGTIDNDPLGKSVSGVAEIRHGPSGKSAAELMAFYVPGAVLVDDGRDDATVDTVLGAAFTQVAAQSEVEDAILAPSPSPSGPGCPKTTSPTTAPAPSGSGETTEDISPAPETSAS